MPQIPRRICLATLAFLLLFVAAPAMAQVGGVSIDADGFLRLKPISSKASLASAKKNGVLAEGPLAEAAPLRYVSLRRLLTAGEDRSRASMGGLTAIQYVIGDPDTNDILLAGPAEPFGEDLSGRLVGLETGRPILQFAFVVEALRHGHQTIGCSIDPDPQRQSRLNEYLRTNSTAATASVVAARYRQMAKIIGQQNVRVFGVPETSHIALTSVEADCILKHIAIGKTPSGVRSIKSPLAHLRPNGNSFQRWWFAPEYESINADLDRLSFELLGPRLKVLAQDEVFGPDGQRHDAAVTASSTLAFAKTCSKKMDRLAAVHPPIAALQGATDCIMAAALIRRERLAERCQFDITAALATVSVPEPDWAAPKTVESFATTKRAGRYVLGLVGGVVIDGRRALRESNAGSFDAASLPPASFEGARFWSE